MPVVINGTTGISGVDGSAGTPSYQGGDTNTGIFYPAADTIAFAEGGAEIARFDSSGNLGIGTTTPSAKVQIFKNAVGASGSTVTAANTALALQYDSSTVYGYHYMNADGVYFIDARTNGVAGGNICLWGQNSVQFRTAGVDSDTARMIINSSGNVLVGTTSNPGSHRLIVNSGSASETVSTTSSSTTGTAININNTSSGGYNWNIFSGGSAGSLGQVGGLIFRDSTNGATRMMIGPDGSLYVGTVAPGYSVPGGIYAPSVHGYTTASAANMFIESGGFFRRSTSSIKYKTDVQDAAHGLADVMKLRPVTYKGINDGEKVFGGLIAEEVHEAGLTEFVQYAEDGSPDALSYGNMVALLTKAIQEQQAMIEELKAKVAALEAK